MPDIGALLWPETVAVIGASPDEHILRGRICKVMLGHPFKGRIYPISRSNAEVMGLKAYPSIADTPEKIDLAVMIIPAPAVADELERCGQAGVKAVTILTSGFAEETGGEGADMQARIKEIIAKYDMAVSGPNSEGFANLEAALCPTFSPAMDAPDRPLLPPFRDSGHVAVIAHSGGMGFAFFDRGRQREIPFSYIVTTGNEAGLNTFDIIEYMLDEGRTDVFLLFLEDVKDPATFCRVAEKALRLGKPIIVAKIGQSDAGQRAAASHTAALAGEITTYRAMFERYGVIEAADLDEMVDLAQAFSRYGKLLPKGKRVGICTGSGGGGGWMADNCALAGLEVPLLDPETRATIDAHLPAYGTSQNPVDGTAQAIREVGYAELGRMVAQSPMVDAVIIVTSARSAATFEREREQLAKVAAATEKPMLMWSYTLPVQATVELINACGFPLYTNQRNCARALAAMADYNAFRERFIATTGITRITGAVQEQASARAALNGAGAILCEYQALDVLRPYGLPVGPARLVSDAAAAAAAAAEFGVPVALKVQSPDIPHKTEAGAVALNLNEPEAIRAEHDTILARAKIYKPDAAVHGVLVQPMAGRGREMVLGINRDAVFGPMLMVGLGGIHVEVLGDVRFAGCPVTRDEALSLLERLRGAALLRGVRGAPPSDVGALADTIVGLSLLAADLAEDIAEIDLNPVIVHPQGDGVSIVDALIIRRQR